jgi:hypothetical protein
MHSYIYVCNFADGKNRSHIDHILINRRYYSRILNVRYFRGGECNTDYYQVSEKDYHYVNKQSKISMWRDLISGR